MTVSTDAGAREAPSATAGSARHLPHDAGRKRLARLARRALGRPAQYEIRSRPVASDEISPLMIELAPDDPVVPLLLSAREPVDVADLLEAEPSSPAANDLVRAGLVLAVPLISAGELTGVIGLGERRSDAGYSVDDRALLAGLAEHAAPAIRISRLVERQRAEARDRERLESELAVARAIQQQFLPSAPPELVGWQLAALYRPARTVGGDFYDFVPLPDGRLMVIVGDVTDKGVPAALVMASTHALLRAYGPRLVDPGEVLATVNELLCGDIPERMFVTCLVMVVDPVNGALQFANAGHPLPIVRRGNGTVELRATGMPLGLMSGSRYDVRTSSLEPGELLLLASDGLVEAHDADRVMYGTPRLRELVAGQLTGPGLIDAGVAAWQAFVGAAADQEDDITLVTVERLVTPRSADDRRLVAETSVPSVLGRERDVVRWLGAQNHALGLGQPALDRLQTAVGEAVMNAIEHGNQADADLSVVVRLWSATAPVAVVVEVVDHDLVGPAAKPPEEPDLDLKLAGRQSPRGWGLYLMRAMTDAVEETRSDGRHSVFLTVRTGSPATGGRDAD